MSKIYSPKIVQDGLVMCLDASNNKSYPTDLPVKNGLVMWMDAADDTTFSYSSGTTVSQWRDKSGSNNHCTPLTAGPTRSSVLNSRKVLAFTTAQTIGSITFNMETSANTVFVVSRYTSSSTNTNRVLTAYYNNWLLGHWGSLVNPYYAEGWVYYPPNSADTIWRIHMGDWGGPSNDLAATYSNGTVLNSGSTVAAAGPKGLGINFQGGEPSTCEAAEIIVFNRVLSAVERRLVHTYLGQKWGISNTDRSIVDLSGNNNHGLLGNGTVAYMPDYNYYNKSLTYNKGQSDTLVVTNSTSLKNNNTTIELYMKFNSAIASNTGDYIQFGVGSGNYAQYYFRNESPNLTWNWYVATPAGSSTPYAISNFSTDIYYLITLTGYSSGATEIYVNGSQVASSANTGASATTWTPNNLTIGGYVWDGYSNSDIALTRIYSRVLSAAEISQNYEAIKSRFANTIVQQGLVLNLDAGNPYSYAGAGTTWYDVSGNSFNATLINSPTYASDNGGVLNWASANSQYATVPMSSTLRVASITEEVWVYLSGTADQVFIGSQYGTSSNNSFAIWVQSGAFAFGVNTGGNFYYSTISTVSTGVWYHLTHTYNGTTQLFYINGVLAATYNSAASGNISYDASNTLLAIGADFNGTGYNVGPSVSTNGKMPVVRIYNIALSAAQVLQNYNATKGKFGL